MQKIVSFIGKTATGKTKALMGVLEREKQTLNHPSTLLAIFDENEVVKYKEILPNATVLNKQSGNDLVGTKVLIADPIEYVVDLDLTIPNEVYFASQQSWTLQ